MRLVLICLLFGLLTQEPPADTVDDDDVCDDADKSYDDDEGRQKGEVEYEGRLSVTSIVQPPLFPWMAQGCHILKSPGFLSCPGKSLNFVCKSWKVLENIWEVSCASPGQNSKVTCFEHKKLGT